MKECTFSPKLINYSHKKNQSFVDLKMLDRNNRWLEKKNNRVDNMKFQLEEAQHKECIFHPDLVKYYNLLIAHFYK